MGKRFLVKISKQSFLLCPWKKYRHRQDRIGKVPMKNKDFTDKINEFVMIMIMVSVNVIEIESNRNILVAIILSTIAQLKYTTKNKIK